ncbi:MAG TPA: AMP-binding protein [Azospirillum sp.]|nr:AMP-binding protein [Azospirillum sp.]
MRLETIVAAHAQRHPQRVAVVCGERRVTYAELDAAGERFARALAARGVGIGDRVVLLLPNRAELVEALLGVLKAGALAVPVSTRLAAAEVRVILEDCASKAVVLAPDSRAVLEAAAAGLPGAPLRIVLEEAQEGELDFRALCAAVAGGRLPPAPVKPPVEPDDCMICYTSGTTGRPKGVIVTHANIVVMHGLINAVGWGLTEADRFLVTTPLAHRTAMGRLGNALCLGATLVVMPAFDAAATVATIGREGVTVMGLVPTVARLLMPEIARDPARCATLRVILATGEAFPVELKRRLGDLLPHVSLYSFFAMTEAGGVTSLGPGEQISHAASVGRPTPGVEVRLVDADGADVPAGEVGEILVRAGAPGRYGTMRGYFNRPEETAATIVDGFIRTGDLGRFDADGYLYVVDRKKDMIVSGGLNIYSKEVEQALAGHPAVQEAAVVGAPDPVYGESVVAFVEPRPGHPVSEAELIEHCRSLIASYKKPRRVVFVEALPRNAVGKVLKAELRRQASPAVAG